MNWPLLIVLAAVLVWALYPNCRDSFRNARAVLDAISLHGIPADHPEHDLVELSERDRSVLMHLDISTPWEDA